MVRFLCLDFGGECVYHNTEILCSLEGGISMKNGMLKVAAATPKIRVADCAYNAGQIVEMMKQAAAELRFEEAAYLRDKIKELQMVK